MLGSRLVALLYSTVRYSISKPFHYQTLHAETSNDDDESANAIKQLPQYPRGQHGVKSSV